MKLVVEEDPKPSPSISDDQAQKSAIAKPKHCQGSKTSHDIRMVRKPGGKIVMILSDRNSETEVAMSRDISKKHGALLHTPSLPPSRGGTAPGPTGGSRFGVSSNPKVSTTHGRNQLPVYHAKPYRRKRRSRLLQP